MSGFHVDTDVVRAAGNDVLKLEQAVGLAEAHVRTHMDVSDDVGWLFDLFAARVRNIREQQLLDYGQGGRPRLAYYRAGRDLKQIARDYEEVDRSVAAKVDGGLKEVEVRQPSQIFTPVPRPVDLGALKDLLPSPEADFEGLDGWLDFKHKVQYFLGLDFLKPLTAIGVADPLGKFLEAATGGWDEIGKALSACNAVAELWLEMAALTQAVPNQFSGTVYPNVGYMPADGELPWGGNAAQAATDWCYLMASKAADHGNKVDLKVAAITLEMVALKDATNELVNVVNDLLAILPWGQSIDDYLKDMLMPWKAAEKLRKIVGLCAKIVSKATLVVDALMVVFALVCELGAIGGVDFPDVDDYSAPDVNG